MELTKKAMDFYLQNRLKIAHYEKQMVLPKECDFTTIEKYKIAFEKCVNATHALEKFCSLSAEGKSYFKQMWQNCFNSAGKFDWVKMVDKAYADFLKNYDAIALSIKTRESEQELFETLKIEIKDALLNLIGTNQGILQKDIYKLLSDFSKQFVIDVLMSLVKENIIKRNKVGNTYELYLTCENNTQHLLRIPSKMTYEMLKEWIYYDVEFYKQQQGYMYQPDGNDETCAHLMPLIWGQQHRDEIDEGGMQKFYILLASILWEIENNAVEESDCMYALQIFMDFNTGKYDCLVENEELNLVKCDFNKVYNYLLENGFEKGNSDK